MRSEFEKAWSFRKSPASTAEASMPAVRESYSEYMQHKEEGQQITHVRETL